MNKLDIKQAEPIRKKFLPDWEIRNGKYLYKKVEFADHSTVLEFLQDIEDAQVQLDQFADIKFFYNEVIVVLYTHDVGGLTQADFELALYIEDALERMGATRL